MALIKHHHHWKFFFLVVTVGTLVAAMIARIRLGEELATVSFIALAFLAVGNIFMLLPLVRVANLTIDPDARSNVCWWGIFVPLRKVSGRFGDIIGLEVKTFSWWTGDRPHRVFLLSRLGTVK